MPTMWRLMIVKIVALRVVVADGDIAGEVHHAGHDREARDRGDHRGRDARAAQDLPQRRRRHRDPRRVA